MQAARAYRKLADEGLVTVRQGRGAVTSAAARARVKLSKPMLRRRFADTVAAGLLGGLSREDVAAAFAEALDAFRKGSRS